MRSSFFIVGLFFFLLNCKSDTNSTHIPKNTTQLFSSDLLCEHLDSTRYAVNLILNESKIKIDECYNCQLITNNDYHTYNIPIKAQRGFVANNKAYYFTKKDKDVEVFRASISKDSTNNLEFKRIANAENGDFKLIH